MIVKYKVQNHAWPKRLGLFQCVLVVCCMNRITHCALYSSKHRKINEMREYLYFIQLKKSKLPLISLSYLGIFLNYRLLLEMQSLLSVHIIFFQTKNEVNYFPTQFHIYKLQLVFVSLRPKLIHRLQGSWLRFKIHFGSQSF